MRTQEEVIKRLINYRKNLQFIKKQEAMKGAETFITAAIIELSWALGEEFNHTYQIPYEFEYLLNYGKEKQGNLGNKPAITPGTSNAQLNSTGGKK